MDSQTSIDKVEHRVKHIEDNISDLLDKIEDVESNLKKHVNERIDTELQYIRSEIKNLDQRFNLLIEHLAIKNVKGSPKTLKKPLSFQDFDSNDDLNTILIKRNI